MILLGRVDIRLELAACDDNIEHAFIQAEFLGFE